MRAQAACGAAAQIYPQFATHNAQTLASIYQMAGDWHPHRYEFQCLHGMCEPLYAQWSGLPPTASWADVPYLRAGRSQTETLLAYLVRRLLENGANTSFINRIADPEVSLDELIADPVSTTRRIGADSGVLGAPHHRIPLPREIFDTVRLNSRGMDLTDENALARLAQALVKSHAVSWSAEPTIKRAPAPETQPVCNPAMPDDVVGQVTQADQADVEAALHAADAAAPAWRATAPAHRAAMLERAADAMEAEMPLLMGLIVREAGKTYGNAIAEVREAVDFLRYYARQARERMTSDTHIPLGPVVCISP